VAEWTTWGDPIPDQPFERCDLGEPAVAFAVPEHLVAELDPNTPPVPGRSAISSRSVVKVVSSSWAIQAARSSQRHWVQ
jgi:hypothetical protein